MDKEDNKIEPAPERTPPTRLSYRKWLLEKQADGFAGILSQSLEDAYGDYCARAVAVPEPAAQQESPIRDLDLRCYKCKQESFIWKCVGNVIHVFAKCSSCARQAEPAPTPSRSFPTVQHPGGGITPIESAIAAVKQQSGSGWRYAECILSQWKAEASK